MKVLKYPKYKFSATVFSDDSILFEFYDGYGNIILVPDAKYVLNADIVLFMKVENDQPVIDYSYSTLRRHSMKDLPDLSKPPFSNRVVRVYSLLE